MIRLEQVVGRIVLAVLVLDATEDRELVTRTEVHLELPHAVHDVIVDPLRVAAALVLARLPVALEDVTRVARVGNEVLGSEPAGRRQRTPAPT